MRWRSFAVTVLITVVGIPRERAAQTDAGARTDASDSLKLLVEKLNDPQRGIALRAQRNIDRAVWVEPVTAVRNGVAVLVTPAHADIHISIDSAGAVWRPKGPLISAPHNPTSARVFIPQGYVNRAEPRRMVSFAPGGGATEYAFERGYAVLSSVLRRGFVLSVVSSWSTVAKPIPMSDWGSNLNSVASFVQKMLVGLGLPPVSYDYAWGESRGARFLAYASELTGTPFAGVIEERGGGDIVDSALEQIELLNDIQASNPADDPAMAELHQQNWPADENHCPKRHFIRGIYSDCFDR